MCRTTRRTASIALLVVMVVAVSTAVAAGGKYVDQKYGFSILIPKGYEQIPTQPNEQLVTAKFSYGKKAGEPTLTICRFQVAGSETTPAAGGDEAEAPPPRRWGPPPPDSALEYLTQRHERMGAQLERRAKMFKEEMKLPAFPEPKKVKFKKAKVEGQLYAIEFEPVRKMRFDGWYILAGIVSNGVEEYVITVLGKDRKAACKLLGCILSFRFKGDEEIEVEDPEERGRAAKKGVELLDPEKRAKIKKDLVGDWKFFDTRHYIVIYNCNIELAKYIAARCEYMRVNAFEKVFPPPYPIKKCGVIRVCKHMNEYLAYGAPPGSGGYWSPGDDELVFPDLSRKKREDPTTIGVLHHEGFHQYVFYALDGNSPPIWFNEGFAEYFFCVSMKSRGKRLIFNDKHPMRSGVIKTALSSGRYTPIKKFIELSQGQHYRNSRLHYAEGWAFCTWLMRYTKNERYREIPRILFAEMQKGFLEAKDDPMRRMGGMGRGPMDNPVLKAATEKAFEGIDLDQLEKDFLLGFKRSKM